jgi:PPOX class probable F420-dependent enzyme
MLSPDARRLVDAPNFAHLATLMDDGSPKVEPVWIAREGDRLLVATDAGTIKARNASRDPRVSLSVVALDNPYEQLLVRGRIAEVRADDDLATLDDLSGKYLDAPFPRRRWGKRIVLVIEPEVARYHLSPLRHTPRRSPA